MGIVPLELSRHLRIMRDRPAIFTSRSNMKPGIIMALVLVATPVAGQADGLDANAQRVIDEFDVERAFVSEKQIFVPFHVEETQRLADAATAGKVTADMRLVILEREEGRLAFLVQQIAYHHVAQGEMKGHPYMVSF